MRWLARLALVATIPIGVALAGSSCSDDAGGSGPTTTSASTTSTSTSSATASGGAGVGGASTMATSSSSSAGGAVIVEVACQGHVYACGNTIDDDGDGLIDAQDPDCLGPCDDTEDSYFGGISGQCG